MYDIYGMPRSISLGRQGEQSARTIEIDCAKMLADYPGARLTLTQRRAPGETSRIVKTELTDAGVLKWSPDGSATAVAGLGRIEITATVNDKVAKSVVVATSIAPSITPPDADVQNSWVKDVLDASDAAKGAMIAAQDSATSAANSAAAAEVSATAAEKSAQAAAESKTGAESAAKSAQAQAANSTASATAAEASAAAAAESAAAAAESGAVSVDATLAVSGKAADAKATGDRIAAVEAQVGAIIPGLTSDEKALLLSLLGTAAYSSADAKASYDALKALWDGGSTPTVVPVTSITLNTSALTLVVGGTQTLTATVLPANATDKTVVWSVSPSGFATVSGGVVKGVAEGSCTVTATAGSKTATCAVTVSAAVVPVTSVTLNKTTLELTEGESETLTATVLPANATDKTVVWSVSPSGFATVTNGVVKAVKMGNCTVTAACGGQSMTCAVTVNAASGTQEQVISTTTKTKEQTVWSNSAPLLKSYYVPLTATKDFDLKKLDFVLRLTAATSLSVELYNKTDGQTVESVTLAATEGDYNVVAEYANAQCKAGKEYQIWLNAGDKVMNYPVMPSGIEAANDYFTTTGTAYQYNNTGIRYMGEVTIEAAASGGTVDATSVTLNKTALTLTVGGTETLTATVAPSDATDKTVTWSVSPEGFATVTGGVVKATAAGSCIVTATCGGKSATCAVTVKAAASGNTNPFPDIEAAYMLPTSKTFVPDNGEYIDTGLKLFETIDPVPAFTILVEAQVGSDAQAVANKYALFHCMEETSPWPGMVLHITGANIQLNAYSSNATYGTVATWKESPQRAAIKVDAGKLSGWRPGLTAANWGAISGMTTAVDKTLILGAYQASDGTKGRFFDGTISQFVVYNSALTDDQITEWITGG